MENLQSTYTSAQLGEKDGLLNYDDLKAMAQKVVVGSTGTGHPKGWFERLMNRVGWYRSSEWYLIDSSRFMNWKTFGREKENKEPYISDPNDPEGSVHVN